MNKQQLASKIWESANRMRSKIEANEYKDYILGFMFYKYLSDKELLFLKKESFTSDDFSTLNEENNDIVNWVQSSLGYFISHENLFSTWLSMGRNFDVANVRDALSAFNRLIGASHKALFEGIFKTLETGLSKLGENSATQTKSIIGLLELIKDIPMDGKQDYDVLGFIYEYLIGMFAANAGKKAGEFYTPYEVSLLMSEIVANHLKDKDTIEIYDPTSGSGSLLINIGKCVAKYLKNSNSIMYYAQEWKENTYNLTRMNLVMRGINPSNIKARNGDTLEDDWPYFDENDPINTYKPLYVDAVVSNPPYSQAWDPSDKENDARYSRFGLAPKTKADYAFLLHDLYHLKPKGIMTIVLPHGVLFRGGEEGQIRKNLIESNNIDAIIGLPPNIFFGTGIPTIIMVLKQKRENNDVLIVDASKGFIKEGKNNKLRASDIKKIVDTVISRQNIEKFSRLISKEEIQKNEYNLNIPRYVDSSEQAETWDIYASMFGGIPRAELENLQRYWKAFPLLKKALFTESTTPYVQLSDFDNIAENSEYSLQDQIKEKIRNHNDITIFRKNFATAFNDFSQFLENRLIKEMQTLNISQEENILAKDIFSRLQDLEILDKYTAYQILDDEWQGIANDLEIIQTEGYDSIKAVDPNMVLKKKNGKEVEVQEGYVGRIIPFKIVQKTLLKAEFDALTAKSHRFDEIQAEIQEIIESLSEDERGEGENSILNDDNTAFISKKLNDKLKILKHETKEEDIILKEKLNSVKNFLNEEKELKKHIKEEDLKLQALTKKTIENLNKDEIDILLKIKWIEPISENIAKMTDNIINNLVKEIQHIAEKYEITLPEIDQEISVVEKELCLMLDELNGNDFDMLGLQEFKALLGGKNE